MDANIPTAGRQWVLREFVTGLEMPALHHKSPVPERPMMETKGERGTRAGSHWLGDRDFLEALLLLEPTSAVMDGIETVVFQLHCASNRPTSADSVTPAGRHSNPCTQSGWRLDWVRVPKLPPLEAGSSDAGVRAAIGATSVHIVHWSPCRTWPTMAWVRGRSAYRSSNHGVNRTWAYHVERGRRH